jgi:hypothetical protein
MTCIEALIEYRIDRKNEIYMAEVEFV